MSVSTPRITADELFENHPPERCELIRGEVQALPLAGARHGAVIVQVTMPLFAFVKGHGLGTVLGAETGFVIARNPDTVRAPDAAFSGSATQSPIVDGIRRGLEGNPACSDTLGCRVPFCSHLTNAGHRDNDRIPRSQ